MLSDTAPPLRLAGCVLFVVKQTTHKYFAFSLSPSLLGEEEEEEEEEEEMRMTMTKKREREKRER
jgi:hypothetical protein